MSIATRTTYNGDNYYRAVITEDNGGAASEWSASGFPAIGTVILTRVTPAFGTSVTVRPSLGRVTGFVVGDANEIGTVQTAAATIRETQPLPYSGLDDQGRIFGHTGYNAAGLDNDATIEIIVKEGN